MDGCFTEIVIPIICSVLSSAGTIIGVYLTIKYQKKKENDEIIQQNKPLFYNYKSGQDFRYDTIIEYIFGNPKTFSYKISGIFRNTEKSIFKVNRIIINDKEYNSSYGMIVEKNQTFELLIYADQKIDKSVKIVFEIKDINDILYKYQINLEDSHDNKFFIDDIREIM